MNTLKGVTTFGVFIRGHLKRASTHKTFSVTSQVLVFSKNSLTFVNESKTVQWKRRNANSDRNIKEWSHLSSRAVWV